MPTNSTSPQAPSFRYSIQARRFRKITEFRTWRLILRAVSDIQDWWGGVRPPHSIQVIPASGAAIVSREMLN
jgi:hypothetical protein